LVLSAANAEVRFEGRIANLSVGLGLYLASNAVADTA
jgi:hypothetical protein